MPYVAGGGIIAGGELMLNYECRNAAEFPILAAEENGSRRFVAILTLNNCIARFA
jgi:hypothetical protein